MLSVNNNPFSSTGRIERGAYTITMIVYLFVILFLNGALEAVSRPYVDETITFLVIGVWFLFMFLPFFATIKRLRDIGKSPWMSCLLLVPLVELVFVIWLFFAKPAQTSNVS